jgi:hypothetical protein
MNYFNFIENDSYRYFISIGAKLFRVVPFYTMAVIFTTLFSQMSLLLAFLFPFKVIVLLNTSEVSNYLALVFVLASAGFYLLYLLSEKATLYCARQGAKKILEKSKKITLFGNQDEIATQAYQRYSSALSALAFLFSGIVIIGIVYPILAGLLIILGAALCLLLVLIPRNHIIIVNIFSALTFFIGFAFMVVAFLQGWGPELLGVIICLLLMRQMMVRTSSLIKDLLNLFSQRNQINALFFHSKTLHIELPQHDENFWTYNEPNIRNDWIKNVLHKVVGITPKNIISQWHQTGIVCVLGFDVTALDENNTLIGHYFVKFFNRNTRALALHEATLLIEPSAKMLPALSFLGTCELEHYTCHVFVGQTIERINYLDLKEKNLELVEKLMLYRPPAHLIENYKRSMPTLGQRLNNIMIKYLCYLSHESQQLADLVSLEKKLSSYCARLNALPMQIVNPDIVLNTIICHDDVKITHWGKWRIEPLGANWPVNMIALPRFSEVVLQLQQIYTEHTIFEKDIKLSALLFTFEYFYQKELYDQSLALLPAIIACEEQ